MTFMPPECFIQKEYQTDNPPVECGMVNNNPALCHHLFQVTQTQGVRQMPADTLRDNIHGVMQAGEGFSDQRHRQITFSKSRIVHDAGLMRQSPTSLKMPCGWSVWVVKTGCSSALTTVVSAERCCTA